MIVTGNLLVHGVARPTFGTSKSLCLCLGAAPKGYPLPAGNQSASQTARLNWMKASLLVRRDVAVDLLLEDGHRHRALQQHRVVELAHVELFAERLLGFPAELPDFQLPDLVRNGLSGSCDVAVRLGPDFVERKRRVRSEELERLFARPSHRVHARVDDEAAGAPHLVREPAEV